MVTILILHIRGRITLLITTHEPLLGLPSFFAGTQLWNALARGAPLLQPFGRAERSQGFGFLVSLFCFGLAVGFRISVWNLGLAFQNFSVWALLFTRSDFY